MSMTPLHPVHAPMPGRQGGSYLFRHRGMAKPQATVRVVRMLGLGLAGLLVWIVVQPWVGQAWTSLFAALSGPSGILEGLVEVRYDLGGRTVMVLPELRFAAAEPGALSLGIHALAVLATLAATFRMSEERAPLVYFLRAVVLIHGSSVLFHALPGRTLPYDPGLYVSGMLSVGAVMVGLVPIVLSATHFLFDFGTPRKIALMVVTMAWMAVLVPVQYAVHALLLHYGGMVFLPLLFILLGLPVDVFLFIALYAWGMSWQEKGSARGNVSTHRPDTTNRSSHLHQRAA